MEEKLNSMTWRLSDPGMDILERAGLAALSMTLRAALVAEYDLAPLIVTEADLTPDSVTVRWTGPAKPAFVKLMAWAWQVNQGVLYFPAIHDDRDRVQWWSRVNIHNGLMRTYFQNPNVQPALEPTTRLVQVDEEKQLLYSFKVLAERVEDTGREINPKTKKLHKKAVPTTCLRPHQNVDEELFDKKGEWVPGLVHLSNWIYPGIAGRYSGEPSWVGQADRALLLMLTPIICFFQRLHGEGNNWVIVVPDVRDIEGFTNVRARIWIDASFVDVASLGDAGLRFLADYSTRSLRQDQNAGCRVIAMGNVNFYPNQSIRKAVLDISDKRQSVRRYRLLQQVFPNHFQRRRIEPTTEGVAAKKKKKTPGVKPTNEPQSNGWYRLPTGRGRIADNLVNGRPWYENVLGYR
jgi:CRISPR-associated protein Cas8a1/Csx13